MSGPAPLMDALNWAAISHMHARCAHLVANSPYDKALALVNGQEAGRPLRRQLADLAWGLEPTST